MKQVTAARNCVWCARMLRAVSTALRGRTSGFSSTKFPKTTIAKVNKPATPATFAAVRCELSISLVVILLFRHDHDFAVRVTFLQIADRGLRLADFVTAIDERRNLSGLHHLA